LQLFLLYINYFCRGGVAPRYSLKKKANIKLKVTTMELENVKGKLEHAINVMEVYKQSVEQLVIEIEKEKQSIQ
jgi:uncharacterized membrane protein